MKGLVIVPKTLDFILSIMRCRQTVFLNSSITDITFYYFQVCSEVIRCLYVLQNDQHRKSS